MGSDSDIKTLPTLARSGVRFSEVKDGRKGVMFGEEELFLSVEHRGKWKLTLFDGFTWEPLTGSMKVQGLEEIRTSAQTKPLRTQIQNRWSNSSEIVEWLIIELSKFEKLWKEEAVSNDDVEAAETDKDEFFEPLKPTVSEEEIRRRALSLLKSPDLMFKIKQTYDKGVKADRYRFVLGEDDKKLLTFLIALSAKTSYPQSLWATGNSGFGKTNMILTTLRLMPRGYAKVRSYLTPGGLRYGRQDYKVLFIQEWRRGAEQEVRLLSREDGSYIYEIAVKDAETGEWKAQVGRIPAKTIMTTSAEGLPSVQMLRRCWLLSVDETEELTAEINKRKAEFREGKVEAVSPDEIIVIQKAVELLEPLDVEIPFASKLVDVLKWDRTRFESFLDVIAVTALLHQFQRPRNNDGEVIATPADLYMAIRVAGATLVQSLMHLPERLRKVWEALPEKLSEPGFTAKDLALKLGVSQSRVRGYLSELRTLGYVVSERVQGIRAHQYWRVTPSTMCAQLLNLSCEHFKWQEIAALTENAILKGDGEVFTNRRGKEVYVSLVDPLTGEAVNPVLSKDKLNGESNSAASERHIYPSPAEIVNTSPKTPEKADKGKNAILKGDELFTPQIEQLSSSSASTDELTRAEEDAADEKPVYLWRRIPPAEKCELCGALAVEYEVKVPGEVGVLRRCQSCFTLMTRMFTKAEWRNVADQAF